MFNKHGGYTGDREVTDYSININPFGISEKLKGRITEKLDELENYPEIDGESTKKKLSEFTGYPEENLIIGNGASELIYLFARAEKMEGKTAGILEPTFTEYGKASEMYGADIERFTDFSDLKRAAEEKKVDFIFICSPNNPTGKSADLKDIEEILNISQKNGIKVFIDESFIEFSERDSSAEFIRKYSLFVLCSVTKIYGIPGIRIGYGIGSEDIIRDMNRFKEPWTVNALALETLETYFEDEEYRKRTADWFREEKEKFYRELSEIEDIEIYSSDANFFMIKLKKSDGKTLKDYCLENGFYIRTCEDFYSLGSDYIRLAVRFREQNEKIAKVIDSFFKSEL